MLIPSVGISLRLLVIQLTIAMVLLPSLACAEKSAGFYAARGAAYSDQGDYDRANQDQGKAAELGSDCPS